MGNSANKIVWQDSFSVNVKIIDEQHQAFIAIINELIDCINTMPDKQKVDEIVSRLTNYKLKHFATEEKYFKDFAFAGAAEHIEAHHSFNQQLEFLAKEYGEDSVAFAFNLVDFLEDWLIDHLGNMDKKYTECFNKHGLM